MKRIPDDFGARLLSVLPTVADAALNAADIDAALHKDGRGVVPSRPVILRFLGDLVSMGLVSSLEVRREYHSGGHPVIVTSRAYYSPDGKERES